MKGIKRLAQHLDISIGTVSRALNGKPDVNEKTRKRVLEAAASLGYVPNQSGRSLRQGNTRSVGFVFESSVDATGESDNFFLGVFDGVQHALRRHHLDLVALPCSTEEDPLEFLQRMVARRFVDAVILSATRMHDDRIAYLAENSIPFITLGRSQTPGPHPWIDLDFEGVADVAIARLVAAGHTRIAIAVPDNDINLGLVFLKGYKRALKAHGLPYEPAYKFRVRGSELGGYETGSQILAMQDPPTAIIVHYELLAIGLYRRLHEAGLTPGRDLSVISFRESPLARFVTPRLTSFRISLRDLGIALGEALLATMPAYAETYPHAARERIWPMELVPGESDISGHPLLAPPGVSP